ncbi:MAG: hypothetical protein IM631_12130 [Cytophagales bacterium]|nr:hypothetical protein [Cytophagales bacterium]MCA6372118.1 hypothetical protein [Cytophagales bacterium]MCA6382262.1 hypothetical protein [Cytophagales bacterium]
MEKVKEKTFQELVEEIRSARRGSVEVPEDFADHFLGSVPPSVQNANGFICGEAYSGDKHYTFFYKRGQSGYIESYQAELLPIKTAKAMLEGKVIDKDGFNFIQIDEHKGWGILIAVEDRKYSKASLWLQDPEDKSIYLAQYLTTYDKRSDVYKIIDATLESSKTNTVKTFGEKLGGAPLWDFDNALASKVVNGVEYRITDENIFVDGKKKYPLYKDKERVDLFDGVSKAKQYVEKSNKHILSIGGEEVWAACSKEGSENNNELSRHEEQIKSTSYAKIKIPLDDLVKNDQDLRDFVVAGMGEGQIKRPINQPIIIGNVSRGYPLKNDCVLDGFHRVLQALINNDKEIEAYVPSNSKYLENVRSEKMGQDQQKVIVGVNDNAGTDVNDEKIYNSKWRGYR